MPRVFNVRLNFLGVSFDPRHAPGDERAAHNRQDQPFYVPSVQALRAGGPFDDQLYAERGQDRWFHRAIEQQAVAFAAERQAWDRAGEFRRAS